MQNTQLQVLLTLKDDLSNNLKKVTNELDKTSNNTEDLGRKFFNASVMGNLVANTVTTLANKLKDFGMSAVQAGISMEQSRIAFQTMLGSGDKAGKLLKQISDFASKTPFDLPQVVDGSKRLLAYNISAEKIIPTFKMLGDVASGLGKDKLDPLITAFGQIAAKGRLMGGELLQLREAGFNLAEAMGITNAKLEQLVEDKAVKFEDVRKAFEKVTSEGGKFYNLMDSQSKSLGGVISNLSDEFVRFSLQVLGFTEEGEIRQGSIFFYLKEGANGLLTELNSLRPYITDTINNVIEWIKTIKDFARPELDNLMGELSRLGENFGVVIQWIKDNQGTIVFLIEHGIKLLITAVAILIKIINDAIEVFKILSGLFKWFTDNVGAPLISTMNSIGDSVGWVVEKFNDLVDAIKKFDEKFKNSKIGGFISSTQGKAASNSLLNSLFKTAFPSAGLLGFASGGVVGGRVGEPQLAIVHGGEQITPPASSNYAGASNNVSNVSINLHVGMFAGTKTEMRNIAEQLYGAITELALRENKTVSQLLGA